jgi:hypothetical protein
MFGSGIPIHVKTHDAGGARRLREKILSCGSRGAKILAATSVGTSRTRDEASTLPRNPPLINELTAADEGSKGQGKTPCV